MPYVKRLEEAKYVASLAINGGNPVRTAPWTRWPQADERALELVTAVLRSGHLSDDGPMERQFAADFASFCTAAHGVCVMNGTVSLRVALEAAGVQAGDEVIVPGLTWVATAGAVVDINAVPIFVDVDPESLCMDPRGGGGSDYGPHAGDHSRPSLLRRRRHGRLAGGVSWAQHVAPRR